MMTFLAPLAVVVVLGGIFAVISGRLSAHRAAVASTIVLVLGALTTIPVLLHLSVSWVVSIPKVGPAVHDALHNGGVHVVGQASAGAAAALLLVVAGWRTARHAVKMCKLRRSHPGGIVVTADDDTYAFAMGGRRHGVVVSQGLVDGLTPREFDVVMAHEQAHLDGRHTFLLSVGGVCAAINPLLHGTLASLRLSLERLADEAAARSCGDKSFVAETIAKVALRQGNTSAALGIASHGVAARVLILASPREETSRLTVVAVTASIVAITAMCALQWHHVASAIATICGR